MTMAELLIASRLAHFTATMIQTRMRAAHGSRPRFILSSLRPNKRR
jgi:hypothetical protein